MSEGAPLLAVRGLELAYGAGPDAFRLSVPSLELRAQQALDLGEVRLDAEVPISGRVIDEDGDPLSLIVAVGVPGPQGRMRFDPALATRTAADGSFVVHGLATGRYVLQARGTAGGFNLVAHSWRRGERGKQGGPGQTEGGPAGQAAGG